MGMCLAFGAHPGFWGDPESDDDARKPLQDHQLHKHAVGAYVDRLLVFAKLLFCEVQSRFAQAEAYLPWSALQNSSDSLFEVSLTSGQPNTGVSVFAALPVTKSDRIAVRPSLSPECPREPVMPPLKSNCPSAL